MTNTSFHHLTEDFVSDFLYYYRKSNSNSGKNISEKISLAIAYANLVIYHPKHITSYHKRMLLKEFRQEEIEELNMLIDQQIS